jgi:glyoxylase-like metal-dependent hydrolase (beta-lactamase superfamily II)
MAPIPFVPALDEPRYGEAVQVSPSIRRVIAENPGKFTYRGTGTYIVGSGDVVVIDPGPRLDSHREALVRALDGHTVRAILVTHCHSDHSPLAEWLRVETGAPTVAFGPHGSVDTDDDDDDLPPPPVDETAVPPVEGPVVIEETIDTAFEPDLRVGTGDVAYRDSALTITAVHTPGHTSNHTCFAFEQEAALFSGDHVMGWSTTVVSRPDGDMRAYIDSLRAVAERRDAVLWPTHGNPVTDPQPYLHALVEHRLEREAQVLAQVVAGSGRIRDIVATLYADVRPELHKPAARSVLSHLVKLIEDGQVVVADGGPPRLRSSFHPLIA